MALRMVKALLTRRMVIFCAKMSTNRINTAQNTNLSFVKSGTDGLFWWLVNGF